MSFSAEVSESAGAFVRSLGTTADGRSASGDWRSFGRDNGNSEATCWRVGSPATIDALVSAANLHRQRQWCEYYRVHNTQVSY